jgi:hypothetical protein
MTIIGIVLLASGGSYYNRQIISSFSPDHTVAKSGQTEEDKSSTGVVHHVNVSDAITHASKTQAPVSVAKNATAEEDKSSNEVVHDKSSTEVVHHGSNAITDASKAQANLRLRFDWTNLAPMSELTKRYVAHQNNCSLPLGNFAYRNRYGLGSDLHLWGQGLCNGVERQARIRTVNPWTFGHAEKCGHLASPMICYFSQSKLNCDGDDALARKYPKHTLEFESVSKQNGNIHRGHFQFPLWYTN